MVVCRVKKDKSGRAKLPIPPHKSCFLFAVSIKSLFSSVSTFHHDFQNHFFITLKFRRLENIIFKQKSLTIYRYILRLIAPRIKIVTKKLILSFFKLKTNWADSLPFRRMAYRSQTKRRFKIDHILHQNTATIFPESF